MKKLFNKIPLVLLTIIISSVAFVPRVEAVVTGSISVLPATTKTYPAKRSWFIYEIDPGKSVTDTVSVINSTDKTVELTVAVLDAAVTKSGGYTLVGNTGQNEDLGTWAKIDKKNVTLPPKSQQNINFTITVPENADVGSHPGGLAIWRTAEENSNKNSMLNFVTRIAARIYLTVPGDIVRGLEVSDLNHSIKKNVLYFSMKLKNKGNVQLNPETDIKIRGLFGYVGEQKGSALGTVFRKTETRPSVPWYKKPPVFGRFVADFRIHYGEKDFKGAYVKDEFIDVRYVFWIIPWWLLLWLLLLILLLLFLRNLWKWLIIQKRLNEKTKKHKVKQGETLTIISGIYDIHPKKIAKFNLLKWPYDLHEGDILLIPQGKMTKEERIAVDAELKLQKERGLEPVIFEKGDKLKDVADFAGITVKEVITINRLMWPYLVRVGKELWVPKAKAEPTKVKKLSDKISRSKLTKKSGNKSESSPKTKKSPRRPKKK